MPQIGAMAKVQWSHFEHQIWHQQVKNLPLAGHQIWALCSGGVDSMLLAQVLLNLSFAGKYKLNILHFHHGGSVPFRNQAMNLVESWAAERGLLCKTVRSEKALNSESQMRQFRLGYLKAHLQPGKSIFALAHHQDDLLETRLIRLIRGVGPQGIRSMKPWAPPLWRPFLEVAKKEIQFVSEQMQIPYLEDPSNQDARYLRNWLRHRWLPSLEQKRPGALQSMARSLELLAQTPPMKSKSFLEPEPWRRGVRVGLQPFLRLTQNEKSSQIARVFFSLGQTDYTQGQVREIVKRIEGGVPSQTFVVGRVQWECQETWLYARNTKSS